MWTNREWTPVSAYLLYLLNHWTDNGRGVVNSTSCRSNKGISLQICIYESTYKASRHCSRNSSNGAFFSKGLFRHAQGIKIIKRRIRWKEKGRVPSANGSSVAYLGRKEGDLLDAREKEIVVRGSDPPAAQR